MRKKFVMGLLVGSLVASLEVCTWADVCEQDFSEVQLVEAAGVEEVAEAEKEELMAAYEIVCQAYSDASIEMSMSLEEFIKQYDETVYATVQEYEEAYINLIDTNNIISVASMYSLSSSSSSSDKWYYNTGTSLPQAADYSKYHLLDTVKKGDIIYEAAGNHGITGHTAIVEGIFYDTTYSQYYIRIIEARSSGGVYRSVLDDERIDDRGVSIYRVSAASEAQCEAAVEFCIGEIGSSYNLDLAKDTSASETDWYCSELNWAAYMNQGINIEASIGEPGVTPRDITIYSRATQAISFK